MRSRETLPVGVGMGQHGWAWVTTQHCHLSATGPRASHTACLSLGFSSEMGDTVGSAARSCHEAETERPGPAAVTASDAPAAAANSAGVATRLGRQSAFWGVSGGRDHPGPSCEIPPPVCSAPSATRLSTSLFVKTQNCPGRQLWGQSGLCARRSPDPSSPPARGSSTWPASSPFAQSLLSWFL